MHHSWVLSTDTPASQLRGQTVYAPRKSTTAKRQNGSSWKIGYGDGSGASGIVYTDKVAIGSVSFPNQAIEAATNVSRSFTTDQYSSGLFGLGMSRGNTVRPNKVPSFLDNVRPSLIQPVFAANLKRGKPGNYDFGFINKTEYKGSIQYVPINTGSIYWEFLVTGYSIGPQPSTRMTTKRYVAIADTGTSLMLVPDDILESYYARVKGAVFSQYWGAWIFPCSSTLPDYAFGIGNYRGTAPGSYFNYGYLTNDPSHCFGGIQSSEGIGFSIFGDVILKSQFVVFDVGNQTLGFANKALA